eukprot:NODE_510_length_7452_cov_0.223990.p5 type:complete len:100 gc:universal NODE_510_length_7452_cov_0.223990:3732-3433(-)
MQIFDYEYVNQLLNEATKEYLVACKNHVVLNISARVGKAFKADLKALPQQFKAPDRNKIIRYFMRCMTREGVCMRRFDVDQPDTYSYSCYKTVLKLYCW